MAKSEQLSVCPVIECDNKVIPKKYDGRPGIALSRFYPELMICSSCGVREALGGKLLLKKGEYAS